MEHPLVRTALGLFARRGVDGVSIAEIAAAAEMSKANVLHHFRTKDVLYRACLLDVGGRLAALVPDVEAAVDRRAALLRAFERWAEKYPEDVRLLAYGLLRLPEHPGQWVLADVIYALGEALGESKAAATAAVVDSLGKVTYAEMTKPLFAQSAKKSSRTKAKRARRKS